MNKFTLKMEQPEYNRVVEVSFEEDYLNDVVMQMDMFLKGCGYVFDQIGVIEEKPVSLEETIHVDIHTPVNMRI